MANRDYKIDIDNALDRAMRSLDIAYYGKNINGQGPKNDPDSQFDPATRQTRAMVAQGYLEVVARMQEERRWEQEQIDKIASKAKDDG